MNIIRYLFVTGPLIFGVTAMAEPAPSIANPATELCIKDGATIVAETAPNGSQHNVCVFASGARINEWAYFRNKHRTTH